ncbi:ABC transporter ATP-binding protein [Bacillus sp. FJAT-49731]|uniref:Carnitine transport ATP-binding protein OpuCA n=1 Tax=Lederbergia citrea TaxID=2833581 RepID=A0A942US98_9BACI|nr:ABC transporter ATP-binding protein [Lederbergia citrea]MBS4178843.1 ABC transporter ATP-binding protein [Lederbergia citrea]MBS4224141.1 ABC transporter ATP-binding protein [Lederbergia citrea]
MAKNAIVFEQVTKQFPKASKPSVYSTNLTIEEGSFVTILGASGCGKTTLLKMVNRIHDLTSGKIYVHGQDITKIPVTELRRNIGYVIQQIGLFPHMTIAENIATVPKELGWDAQKIEERIDFLLELIELPPQDYRKRYPRQLSGGQQQRVGLARALAGNPSIMLMDEPFGAIDAITRSSLQDEMIQIQRKLNKTILFVTHDIDEALKLGDKIVIMNEGVIQQFDTPLNIITNPANSFVSQLVHSDDVVQHLGLMRADHVMLPLIDEVSSQETKVDRAENLKNVLTQILKGHSDSVIVTDNETPIGRITLAELKSYIAGSRTNSAS